MTDYMSDLDEVTRLIGLYIDGANGDVGKLKEAFHPDAWMMGHIGLWRRTFRSRTSSR